MSETTVTLRGNSEVDFKVRLVNKGQRFGRHMMLTHEHDIPLVEFYDTRYPHTMFGQFVSRYEADTLLEATGGLNLHGAVPEWYIDALAMSVIRDWVKNNWRK